MNSNLFRYFVFSILFFTSLLSLHGEMVDHQGAKNMVSDAFRDVLHREPSRAEMGIFVYTVIEDQLSYYQLKQEIRWESRDGIIAQLSSANYRPRSHRRDRHQEFQYYEPRRWIEGTFERYVGRLPSQGEMDLYSQICLDDNLSQYELENLIREDYEGIYEPYHDDSYYCYDYDRYTSDDEVEIIIIQAYRDILEREPDTDGLRNYKQLMLHERWSEKRIRTHLSRSPELLKKKYEKMIHRAFEDLLNRSPQAMELGHYVEEMLKYRWGEKKLKNSIRQTREYQYDLPIKMIKDGYRDVLLREVDEGSIDSLRREIVRSGWAYQQVKKHLRKSQEFKRITIPKIIETAYMDVLKRKPDPSGFKNFAGKLQKGWTLEQIKSELRKSKEYRNMR